MILQEHARQTRGLQVIESARKMRILTTISVLDYRVYADDRTPLWTSFGDEPLQFCTECIRLLDRLAELLLMSFAKFIGIYGTLVPPAT